MEALPKRGKGVRRKKMNNRGLYLVRENYDANILEHTAWFWESTVSEDGIAVLGVTQPLSNHKKCFFFEIPEYKELSSRIERFVNNPEIKAIVVLLDSPGGAASGLFECADAIWAMHEEKPIYACVNGGMACSAAYLIAASTGHIYATETSEIGSCGVMCTAEDDTGYWEKQGVRFKTFFSKHAKKKNLSPFSEEGGKALQKSLDQTEDFYFTRLGTYRGMDKDECISGFGGGEVFFSGEALERGMIDKIATLDELLSEIRRAIADEDTNPDYVNPLISSSLEEEGDGGLSMEKKNLSDEQSRLLSELKSNPTLLASLMQDAVAGERKRVSELNAVRSECTAAIIDKALSEGSGLSDIAPDLVAAYKAENEKLAARVKELEAKVSAFDPIKKQAENSQEVKVPAGMAQEGGKSAVEEGRNAALTAFGVGRKEAR